MSATNHEPVVKSTLLLETVYETAMSDGVSADVPRVTVRMTIFEAEIVREALALHHQSFENRRRLKFIDSCWNGQDLGWAFRRALENSPKRMPDGSWEARK